MSANITAQLVVSGVLDTALDIGTAQHQISYSPSWPLTDGAGANQIQQVFADTRTLAASASESLDLAGSLTNAFGATITLTKVKALIIRAAAGNTNDVVVGGAASNAVASIFGATTGTLNVKPGGAMVLIAPDANGYAVTATTADLLKIANSGSGTSVSYDIIILGV